MLANAYFLATIRFDTAENEPAKYETGSSPQGGGLVGRGGEHLCTHAAQSAQSTERFFWLNYMSTTFFKL